MEAMEGRSFVMTPAFDRAWANIGLGDDELRKLQNILLEDPDAGDVIPETGGARKIRIPLKEHGKSGGGRVIYVDVELTASRGGHSFQLGQF